MHWLGYIVGVAIAVTMVTGMSLLQVPDVDKHWEQFKRTHNKQYDINTELKR